MTDLPCASASSCCVVLGFGVDVDVDVDVSGEVSALGWVPFPVKG